MSGGRLEIILLSLLLLETDEGERQSCLNQESNQGLIFLSPALNSIHLTFSSLIIVLDMTKEIFPCIHLHDFIHIYKVEYHKTCVHAVYNSMHSCC